MSSHPLRALPVLQMGLHLVFCCHLCCGLRNGLALTPMMGWSNWEATGCTVSEDIIKDSAEAMISKGLRQAGYDIVGIDDCWAERQRNATGHLVPTANFSSGMKALGDYLHERGFKFGIYSSAGVKCCQQTMPGSLGYEWIDAQTFASWGVDYLKYDGCFMEEYASVLEDAPRRFPFTPPPILRYPIMAQALNATGRHISYLCNFPWQFWGLAQNPADGGDWVGEFCNAWRTGGDAAPGYANALSYVEQSELYAEAVRSGPGRWNHLDSLEIGNNVSWYRKGPGEVGTIRVQPKPGGGAMTEAQEHAIFSLYAVVKSPLFIGADVRTLSGHSLATYLNTEVIAVSQDKLGARGHRLRTATAPRPGEVWAVELEYDNLGVVLLNTDEAHAADISVSWGELGLAAGAEYELRDLWKHADLGPFRAHFTATAIAPTSALFLRFKPAAPASPRISSDASAIQA